MPHSHHTGASDAIEGLLGISDSMRMLRQRIPLVARADLPILIVGETGTGKEVCARAVAQSSGRTPFCPVNCAAIPEGLAESELFGHVRGSFTGALRDHAGAIAAANGGVLFLDELAELPLPIQAKLLRTLESGEYQPVGARHPLQSHFLILAATNEEPEQLVAKGRLRADLLHRLGKLPLRLPPLRERLEDIPLLTQEFVRRYSLRLGLAVPSFTTEATALLVRHHWPGNVRELKNVVEAAAALSRHQGEIDRAYLLEVLMIPEEESGSAVMPTLAETLRLAEQQAIQRALAVAGGNRAKAAALLEISAATFYRKLSSPTHSQTPVPTDGSQI